MFFSLFFSFFLLLSPFLSFFLFIDLSLNQLSLAKFDMNFFFIHSSTFLSLSVCLSLSLSPCLSLSLSVSLSVCLSVSLFLRFRIIFLFGPFVLFYFLLNIWGNCDKACEVSRCYIQLWLLLFWTAAGRADRTGHLIRPLGWISRRGGVEGWGLRGREVI